MIEKLKKIVDLRLAATVALGVFVALFAYRLFMWAAEWWSYLGSDTQESDIVGALVTAAIAYCAYRVIRRYRFVRKLRAQGLPVPVWPAPRASHL